MDSILSVDLDIMMSPYCGIYTKMVDVEKDREFNWERGITTNYQISDFKVNQEYKQLLVDIITNYQNKVDKVYVGTDHSSILTAIQMEKENFNSYYFDVYNIDYHHDICYNDVQEHNLIDDYLVTCGSWVGYLGFYKYINNYKWYRGAGSETEFSRLSRRLFEMHLDFKLFDKAFPMNIENVKVLFVSLSPDWIPPTCDKDINDIYSIIDKDKLVFLDGIFNQNRNKKDFLNENFEHKYEWLK